MAAGVFGQRSQLLRPPEHQTREQIQQPGDQPHRQHVDEHREHGASLTNGAAAPSSSSERVHRGPVGELDVRVDRDEQLTVMRELGQRRAGVRDSAAAQHGSHDLAAHHPQIRQRPVAVGAHPQVDLADGARPNRS